MTDHRCRTKLISDVPATKDAFGAHTRVADGIAECITEEPGGRSIGLEGQWGSGKSTIVGLVKRKLSASKDVHVWVFDAWAHEGDPLRRTFLEGVIGELMELEWLSPRDEWEKELRRISLREKSVHTKTRPKVELGGYLVAVGLMLVPFGTVLFRAGVDRGVGFVPSADINELALLGAILIAGPAIVPLLSWAGSLLLRRVPYFGDYLPNLTLRQVFTPLAKTQDIEVFTESSEDQDPTSVDFQRKFDEALKAALPDTEPDRRLVIVLDNLDRLATAEQAQRIWATIQPYLQQPRGHTWQSRIWIVVTYDREALTRLAPHTGEDGELRQDGERRQSYVDKTIRAEFSVPPPVLSNWRRFFRDRLGDCLVDHPPEDLDRVVQLVSALHPKISEPPTPRAIVQLVNGIGGYHRQWQHEVPLVHIGYFVMARRKGWDLETPVDPGVRRLLEDTIEDDLYVLAFGVSRPVAGQLRLGDAAIDALARGDTERWVELTRNSQGLWPAAAVLIQQRLTEWEVGDPAKILKAFAAVNETETEDEARKEIIHSLTQSASRVTEWPDADARSDRGIISLGHVPGVVESYLESRARQVEDASEVDGEVSVADAADTAKLLIDLHEAGLGAKALVKVENPSGFTALASAVARQVNGSGSDKVLQSLDFTGEDGDLWQYIIRQADEDAALAVARARACSVGTVEWNEIATPIATILTAPFQTPLVRRALFITAELAAVKEFVSAVPAPPMHQRLMGAISTRNASTQRDELAAAVFALLRLGEISAVEEWLHTITSTSQTALGRSLCDFARTSNSERWLWQKALRIAHPALLKGLLSELLVIDVRFIKTEDVINHHATIAATGLLREVVRGHIDQRELRRMVMGQPFQVDLVDLYSVVAGATSQDPEHPAFARWTREGLGELDVSGWEKAVAHRDQLRSVAGLLDAITPNDAAWTLPDNVEGALANNIGLLLHTATLATFFPLLTRSAQTYLADALIEWAMDNRKVLTKAWFYERGGPVAAVSSRLDNIRYDIVKKLLIPIARNTTYPVAALEWLAGVLENRPEIIHGRGKRKQRAFFQAVADRLNERELSDNRRAALVRLQALDGVEP